MAITNAPEEMLDNSMDRRRVGVTDTVVFWRVVRVAATYDSIVYKSEITLLQQYWSMLGPLK